MGIIHRINIVEAGNEFRRVKKGTTLHCACGSPQQANLAMITLTSSMQCFQVNIKSDLKKKKKRKQDISRKLLSLECFVEQATLEIYWSSILQHRDTKCPLPCPDGKLPNNLKE